MAKYNQDNEDFFRFEARWLHNEGASVLTAKEARALASKLVEMADAAEWLGEPDPCVMLDICECQPGSLSTWGIHEEPGIYLAPSVLSRSLMRAKEMAADAKTAPRRGR
jgi:hypothetical protein